MIVKCLGNAAEQFNLGMVQKQMFLGHSFQRCGLWDTAGVKEFNRPYGTQNLSQEIDPPVNWWAIIISPYGAEY